MEHPTLTLARTHLADLQCAADGHGHGLFALVLMLREAGADSAEPLDLRWEQAVRAMHLDDARWLALRVAPATAHRLGVALHVGLIWCLVASTESPRVVLVDLAHGTVTG